MLALHVPVWTEYLLLLHYPTEVGLCLQSAQGFLDYAGAIIWEIKMNKYLQNIKNRIYFSKEKTYEIEEDIDCEVTDEIEKALWEMKEEMDLPTEEVEKAVTSRQKNKGKK